MRNILLSTLVVVALSLPAFAGEKKACSKEKACTKQSAKAECPKAKAACSKQAKAGCSKQAKAECSKKVASAKGAELLR